MKCLRRKSRLKKGLIIIDFDGTLYNTRIANCLAYVEALREYGYILDKKLFYESYSGMYYLDFLPEIVNSMSTVEKVHEKKVEIYNKYYDIIAENVILYDFLKGIKNDYYLVLLTNASRKNCLEVLKYFDKDNFFDDIVTGDDVEKRKPHNEGINKIIQKYKVPLENILLIEDDIRNVNIPEIKSLVLNNYE